MLFSRTIVAQILFVDGTNTICLMGRILFTDGIHTVWTFSLCPRGGVQRQFGFNHLSVVHNIDCLEFSTFVCSLLSETKVPEWARFPRYSFARHRIILTY